MEDGVKEIEGVHITPERYALALWGTAYTLGMLESSSTRSSHSQIHRQKRRMLSPKTLTYGVLTVILTLTLKSGAALKYRFLLAPVRKSPDLAQSSEDSDCIDMTTVVIISSQLGPFRIFESSLPGGRSGSRSSQGWSRRPRRGTCPVRRLPQRPHSLRHGGGRGGGGVGGVHSQSHTVSHTQLVTHSQSHTVSHTQSVTHS